MSSAKPGAARVTRVLVVDDHAFIRAQVTEILSAHQDIEVVGECDDGSGVAELVTRTLPNVVVMDLRMGRMSGTEATGRLRRMQSSARVLILTGSGGHHLVTEAAEAGAAGLIWKGGNSATLVAAVRAVAAGGTVWPDVDGDPLRP